MTRVLIDACVLYPTVLREITLGVAARGLFSPFWSARILEEWGRAAARRGDAAVARAEIAAVSDRWPDAVVTPAREIADRLWLPDPDDVHVLAAAIQGNAESLLTLNLRDFPTRILSAEGIVLRHPDTFLLEFFHADPDLVRAVVEGVWTRASDLSGEDLALRPLLKRARLPRLGRALG